MADKIPTRVIEIEVSAGGGSIIKELATMAQVQKHGMPSHNEAVVEINNLKQSTVEQLTVASHEKLKVKDNFLTVKAGDADGQVGVIFEGNIIKAYGIYPSADIGIHIEAVSALKPMLDKEEPYTFDGEISALTLLQEFVGKMEGYTFQNNGVEDQQLTDPAINGSNVEKCKHVAKQMKKQIIFDDKKVILTDFYKPLQGEIVKVSKDSGMIGYPEFSTSGIVVRTLFNPKYFQGGAIEVESIVPKASGKWKIIKIDHDLQAQGYGDAWDTTLDCTVAEG